MNHKINIVQIIAMILVISLWTSYGRCQTVFSDKIILWVDSYQSGYAWSDSIERGIASTLKGSGAKLVIHRMDTKQCRTTACMKAAAQKALKVIQEIRPDIVIASDDNAQKYLIVPYLKNTEMPVIFCGVNWDAAVYGYPTENITGMIEVELAKETISHMQRFSKGNRIGCISGDTASDRKNVQWLNRMIFDDRLIVYRVKTFEEFKKQFKQLQYQADMMFFRNNAAIEGWNDLEAKEFIRRNLRIPSASNNDWMAPYVVYTLGKIPEEQGQFAAATALDVLRGKKPSDIPVTTNRQANLTVNLEMAEELDIVFPLSVLKIATVIGRHSTGRESAFKNIHDKKYIGRKVCWVDSYHSGYEWSDGIEMAIKDVFYGTGIDLQIVRMNTKNENTTEQIKSSATRVKAAIDRFNPDLIIASDDNAQKHLIVPHYMNIELPVVFCGVNEDVSDYGYPASNITGMIEINPVKELNALLMPHTRGQRIGMLAGNTISQQKTLAIYNQTLFNGKLKGFLVNTWDEFKQVFIQAQQQVDMLILANYSGIKNWDMERAEHFIWDQTRIPTGSYNYFMDNYVVCTMAKFPQEQGRYAAITALKILDNTPVSSIPVVSNTENRLTINLGLAHKVGITFPLSVLKQARLKGQERVK